VVGLWFYFNAARTVSTIDDPFFREQLEAENITAIELGKEYSEGAFESRPPHPGKLLPTGKREKPPMADGKPVKLNEKFRVRMPTLDAAKEELYRELRSREERGELVITNADPGDPALMLTLLLFIALPIGMLIFFWIMLRRTQNQMMGGGFLSGFSKSPAKRYEGAKQPIAFKDVAGLEGVKADLQEIVDFLKAPDRFQRLGGRVPKGVLLNGPPGTGKTMLARAVAGEAGVPFFSVSGSEFIQMFVGVGASRVRDLFKTAKDAAPAIIFVDEIDAVGRQRGAGLGGGHDEREQTLNQILSEMDGFTQSDSVIVLAATNRPDVLDPALLRPGRFDRHITVNKPSQKGRLAIFKVHVRDVPLADDVDLERLATGTMGLTGADIRNMVNEAALWATREDKDKVYMEDFEYARDKILMGSKRDDLILDKEKRKTAYHEAGHALVAWLRDNADRIHKVTIIPRGRALGVTMMLPEEERMNITESELETTLMMALGGRAAEQIVYDECSAGAENDLERATSLARRMVTQWGMSERLGPVSYKFADEDPFLGREIHQSRNFSEHTMQMIDEEVARILHGAAEKAEQLLRQNRDKLETLTEALCEREEISDTEITELIGPSVRDTIESNGSEKAAETAETSAS